MPSIKVKTYAMGCPESNSHAHLPGIPAGTEVTVTWEEEEPKPIVWRGTTSGVGGRLYVLASDLHTLWPATQADFKSHGFKPGQRVEVRITPVED